jgi:hypothetical protein
MNRVSMDSLERRIIVVNLAILTVASIGLAIAAEFFAADVNAAWSAPLVMFSLLLIARLVTLTPVIASDVKFRSKVAESGRVDPMPNAGAYTSLKNAPDAATSSLDLTDIRSAAAPGFGEDRK